MSATIEQIYKEREKERGAALIAAIAVLALVSVLLTVGLNIFYVETEEDRRLETQARMEFVIDQIASYVQRESRLPCPADPANGPYGAAANFGLEDRNGGPGSNNGCNAIIGGRFTGIVPFQTLNIDEDRAKDSWGRYLTYAISPVLADTRNPAGDGSIFYACRRRDSWVDTTNPLDLAIPPPPAASNPRKARFCCPPPDLAAPNTDIEIRDETGAQIDLRVDQPGVPAAGTPQRHTQATEPAAWDSIDTPLPVGPVPVSYINNANIVTFAIALVSHGPNGGGAYLGNGTLNQFPRDAAIIDENENADFNNDNVFIDRSMVLAEGSNNYFDDLVLWRTQYSLFNELNNASCARPWR